MSIKQILDVCNNPVIAWSGGRDSTVLLHLARQINLNIPIVWFRQNVSKKWNKWCESIILKWDLSVFTYPASDSYYLPNDKGLTLVDEYSFGLAIMPVLQDVKEGGECAANVSRETIPSFNYPWAETLTGYRETDQHFIVGQKCFPADGFQCGNTKLYAPLRKWTDGDIERVWTTLDLPQPPDDRLPRCTNCLQGETDLVFCPEAGRDIPRLNWDKIGALDSFRKRFVPHFHMAG